MIAHKDGTTWVVGALAVLLYILGPFQISAVPIAALNDLDKDIIFAFSRHINGPDTGPAPIFFNTVFDELLETRHHCVRGFREDSFANVQSER